MHATPADFSAHAVNRKNYNDISEQQVFQNMDVVFGGGYKFFTAADREDKQDLISEIKGQGYQLVADKKQFDAITDGKVFGLFAPSDLPYELDRKQDEQRRGCAEARLQTLQIDAEPVECAAQYARRAAADRCCRDG